jgi:hypothetical protein
MIGRLIITRTYEMDVVQSDVDGLADLDARSIYHRIQKRGYRIYDYEVTNDVIEFVPEICDRCGR